MGGYGVVLAPAALRSLRKMDATGRVGVLGILENLRADAHPAWGRLTPGSAQFLRLRAGDYRVIYTVDDEARRVVVLVAGYRHHPGRRVRRWLG